MDQGTHRNRATALRTGIATVPAASARPASSRRTAAPYGKERDADGVSGLDALAAQAAADRVRATESFASVEASLMRCSATSPVR